MFNLGLKGKRPKEKYHSYKGDIGKKADNIINRDFKATKPNQKWTTDVSQFNFSWGKCYLSPILDMYNDEIISYDLSLRPNLEQIINMLNKAFNKYDSLDDLIFHSDQGWQYQHQTFIDKLNEKGITFQTLCKIKLNNETASWHAEKSPTARPYASRSCGDYCAIT